MTNHKNNINKLKVLSPVANYPMLDNAFSPLATSTLGLVTIDWHGPQQD